MSNIPMAAVDRLQELKSEAEKINNTIRDKEGEQVGTNIPHHFLSDTTFTVNPSAISTGMIAAMVETDETIQSAAEFKVMMMLSKIGEYHHEKPEIKDFVQNFLKRMRRPTWEESLESQASSNIFGFSSTEITWGLNNDLEKVPVRLSTYHPNTIAFETDGSGQITDNGVLQFVQQSKIEHGNPNENYATISRRSKVKNPFKTPMDRLLPVRLPFLDNWGMVRISRDKIIHHINKAVLSFGSPYGKTSIRACHLPWQMKIFFMQKLGLAGHRNSTPTIVGQAPAGQNKVQLKINGEDQMLTPNQALLHMLSNRTDEDAIVIGSEKEGYKITVVNNEANLGDYLSVINTMNTYIFRAFLLPSLVMSDGEGGNRALGDKHFDIVNHIAEKEASKFKTTLINDLIEKAVVDNFGEQDDYGCFEQRPSSIEELERFARIFDQLTNAGYMSPDIQADLDNVRAKAGLESSKANYFENELDEEI